MRANLFFYCPKRVPTMPVIKVLPHAEYCPDGVQIQAQAGDSICEALLEHGVSGWLVAPGGGASGWDSMRVLDAARGFCAIVPVGLRSTLAVCVFENGLEKGSAENRVASEQPVRRAAAAVARTRRSPMRDPGTRFIAPITQPIRTPLCSLDLQRTGLMERLR